MGLRGASSIEYLFITGIAISALAIIVLISMNTGSDSIRVAQAKDSVEKLALSADYVYSLGPGSRETVSVYLPQGIELINVSEDRIHMRVALSSGSSDVYAKAKGRLFGKISGLAGAQKVTITTLLDGSVLFGDALLECSPSRISKSIPYGGTGNASVSARNIATFQITGLVTSINGSASAITAFTQPSPPSIDPGQSASAGLQFTTAGSSPGIYSGILDISGSNGSRCFSELVVSVYNESTTPLNESDGTPPDVHLALFNSCTALNLSVIANDVGRGGNIITDCHYQMDGGNWIYLNPVDFTYDSPVEAASGVTGPLNNSTHLFTARCTDAMGNNGTHTVFKSCLGDVVGPLADITGVEPLPNVTTADKVKVNANCNDTLTGGSFISGAQIRFDNDTATYAMDAANGFFNQSSAVGVTYTTSTPMPGGLHTVGVSCTDSQGNTGNFSFKSFYVINNADIYPPIITSMEPNSEFLTTVSNISMEVSATDLNSVTGNITGCFWMMEGDASIVWNSENITMTSGEFGNSSTVSFDINIGSLDAGEYMVWAYCTDDKGNSGNPHPSPLEVLEGDIMLVIDRSGSMDDPISSTTSYSNNNPVQTNSSSLAYLKSFSVASKNGDLANISATIRSSSSSCPAQFEARVGGIMIASGNTTSTSFVASTTQSDVSAFSAPFTVDLYMRTGCSASTANYSNNTIVATSAASYAPVKGLTLASSPNPADMDVELSAPSTCQFGYRVRSGGSTIASGSGAGTGSYQTFSHSITQSGLITLELQSSQISPTAISRNGSSFGSVSFSGSDNDWDNEGNAQTSNNARASVSLGNSQQSEYLQATAFGFAIPSGAAIQGIRVNVERGASDNDEIDDYRVRLVKGGSIQSAEDKATYTNWDDADTLVSYGGPADMWSNTWSVSDVNSANFGVAFAAQHDGGGGPDTAMVDYIGMTVYYTMPCNVTSRNFTVQQSAGTTAYNTNFGFTQVSGAPSQSKMAAAKSAAGAFVDVVDSSAQVGLVSFSDGAATNMLLALMAPPAKTSLKASINGLSTGGGTCIACGLNNAVAELISIRARDPDATERVVILLTDGKSTSGDSMAAATNAHNNRVKVYTIGFGNDVDELELRGIAGITEGKYYFAPDAATLTYIYQHIGE